MYFALSAHVVDADAVLGDFPGGVALLGLSQNQAAAGDKALRQAKGLHQLGAAAQGHNGPQM